MTHLSLIPFGLRSADQRLVDVSEVPQGGGCGCICPSCRASLIARQGHIKQWHFAHDFRGVEGECASGPRASSPVTEESRSFGPTQTPLP